MHCIHKYTMSDPSPPTNRPSVTDNNNAQQPTATFGSGGYSGNSCCGCRCSGCSQYNPPLAPPEMPTPFPAPPFAGGPGPNCLIYGGNCGCNCCGPAAPCCSGCIPCQPPYQGYFPGFPIPCGVQQCFPTPFYPLCQGQPCLTPKCVPLLCGTPGMGPYPGEFPQCGPYPPPVPPGPLPRPPVGQPPVCPRNNSFQTYSYSYLPQGAYIVTRFDPTYQYSLPQSTTYCFPFKLTGNMQQIVVNAAMTTPFENVFIPGVRSWASLEPAGISISASPLQSQQTLTLPPTGVIWDFWSSALNGQIVLAPNNVNSWINPNTLYWFNVQNVQNRPNSFYCRFNFLGPNINIII